MKLHESILITTVIPSYNKHWYLQDALISVLQQTHTNQQVLIINDFPDEEKIFEVNELQKFDSRIKIIHNKQNLWIAASRNIGIQYAKWKHLAFLDDDDVWKDDEKLEKQLWVLEKDKNIAVVWSSYSTICNEQLERVLVATTDEKMRNSMNFLMPMLQSTMVIRKEAIDRVWWYDVSCPVAQDYDVLYRLGMIWDMANIADDTTNYRIHWQNISIKRWRELWFETRKLLQKYGRNYPYFYQAILIYLLVKRPYRTIQWYIPKDIHNHIRNLKWDVATMF